VIGRQEREHHPGATSEAETEGQVLIVNLHAECRVDSCFHLPAPRPGLPSSPWSTRTCRPKRSFSAATLRLTQISVTASNTWHQLAELGRPRASPGTGPANAHLAPPCCSQLALCSSARPPHFATQWSFGFALPWQQHTSKATASGSLVRCLDPIPVRTHDNRILSWDVQQLTRS